MALDAVIDARDRPGCLATNGAVWRLVTDRVMGGVSDGRLSEAEIDGRRALCLEGSVRLENDGGFVQMALDLAPDGRPIDASRFAGLALEVSGNGERYGLHLRTADVARPWQSYRASFEAGPGWQRVALPFSAFAPHRIAAPFDASRLRRIGLVAIGRAFEARLCLARIAFLAPQRP